MNDTNRLREFTPTQNQVTILPNPNFMDRNQLLETSKILFDEKRLHMISDLSGDEIRLLTRMSIMADLKNLKSWKNGINDYLAYRLSHQRKSRNELIKVLVGSEKKRLGERIKEVFKPTESD